MLVLFKNVKNVTGTFDVAVRTSDIIGADCRNGHVSVDYKAFDGDVAIMNINLPIEQVVGLINQAMGAVAVPDALEKSVVVITGKDSK